jgi:hypothetical protein
MDYHIVSKVELISNELVYNKVGYTESHSDALALDGYQDYQDWISDNSIALENGSVVLSDHFNTYPICHEAVMVTDNIDGLEISLITTL